MPKFFRISIVLGCALSLSTTAIAKPAFPRPAPDCPLTLPQGQTSLKKYSGKVIYLDFWASWCVACLASFPFMERMQQELGPEGLQVIAVNMDQKAADAQRFLSSHHVTFPIAIGRNDACARELGVNAMPSTFLIDRRGTIRAAHESFRPSDAPMLRAMVQKVLSEPRP